MKLCELIENRYSCRSYKNQSVEKALVESICLTAAKAPSACNSQPWKIHALYGEKKDEVAAALEGLGLNKHAKTAPVLLAIEQTPAKYLSRFDGIVKPEQWAQCDVGILAAHIVLLAKENGLDSCIIGYSNLQKVQAALHTENDVPLFITLGYAAENDTMPVKKRKPAENVLVFNE